MVIIIVVVVVVVVVVAVVVVVVVVVVMDALLHVPVWFVLVFSLCSKPMFTNPWMSSISVYLLITDFVQSMSR